MPCLHFDIIINERKRECAKTKLKFKRKSSHTKPIHNMKSQQKLNKKKQQKKTQKKQQQKKQQQTNGFFSPSSGGRPQLWDS